MYIKLICHYGFVQERIRIEYPIQIGSTKRRADIVVLNKEMRPYVIAETKVKITEEDSIDQLQSYINVTRANYGILASQSGIAFFQSIHNSLNSINDIPTSDSPIVDIFSGKEQSFDMMGFQKLYRINEETSIVVINDTKFTISNKDLLTYNNMKKIALSKSVVLPLNINDNHWHEIVKNLFEFIEDAPATELAEEFHKDCEIFKDAIRSALRGKRKPTVRILCNRKRRLNKLKPIYLQDIISYLVSKGEIIVDETGRKPMYRLAAK